MRKSALVAGGAIGFVLGSRAGRSPYDKIEEQLKKVAGRREVRDAAAHMRTTVRKAAKDGVRLAVDSGKEAVAQTAEMAKSAVHAKGEAETVTDAHVTGDLDAVLVVTGSLADHEDDEPRSVAPTARVPAQVVHIHVPDLNGGA